MFPNRKEAGEQLANRLLYLWGTKAAVLALPRGGVAVGYEVAQKLKMPLDTIVARKLASRDDPEYGIGAIAPGDIIIVDLPAAQKIGMSQSSVDETLRREKEEMERKISFYRSGEFTSGESYEAIIIVDDGIATGLTMRAAIESAKLKYRPAKLILAVPVCAQQTLDELKNYVQEIVCLEKPEQMIAVGLWYAEFPQVTEEETVDYLERANKIRFAAE